MTYEIGQLDIPDRQLMPGNAHPKVSKFTEIGEAIITHTIFGRAKVRIIRKHDKLHRTLWLLALLAAIAAAAAAWQGWVASQQTEPLQSTDPAPSLSTNVQESVPATPLGYNAQSAVLSSVESKPVMPPQAGIGNLPISQKPVPQQLQAVKESGQMPAKPVAPQSSLANKPQLPSLVANDNAARKPMNMQTPPKPTSPRQVEVPTIATPRAVQSAASSPAAVAPMATPPLKEDTSILAPAGNKQAADPVNVEP